MSANKCFKLLVTDGQRPVPLLWLKQNQRGLYAGMQLGLPPHCPPETPQHYSYHADGQVHTHHGPGEFGGRNTYLCDSG